MNLENALKTIFGGVVQNISSEEKERRAFGDLHATPVKLLMPGERIFTQRTDQPNCIFPVNTGAMIIRVQQDLNGKPDGYIVCDYSTENVKRKPFIIHESQVMPYFVQGETINGPCPCDRPDCKAVATAVVLEVKEDDDNEQFSLCYEIKTEGRNKTRTIHGQDRMFAKVQSKKTEEIMSGLWEEHKKKKASEIPKETNNKPKTNPSHTMLERQDNGNTIEITLEEEDDSEDSELFPIHNTTSKRRVIEEVIHDLQELLDNELCAPCEHISLFADYLKAVEEVIDIKRDLLKAENGEAISKEDELEDIDDEDE